jgi:ABC-type multidrug transport system fused ATPase/permease subunit
MCVSGIRYPVPLRWVSVVTMTAGNIISADASEPYGRMLTCYSLGAAAMGLGFGFLVTRSEYYALPTFMLNSILAVAGTYLAAEYSFSAGSKLFIVFLSPPVGLAMGIVMIENQIYRFEGEAFDYNYHDTGRQNPSLSEVNGMMLLSFVLYMLIVVNMPFSSLMGYVNQYLNNGGPDHAAAISSNINSDRYPCDLEPLDANPAAAAGKSALSAAAVAAPTLLKVSNLYHIYPDGTKAVTNMSFTIREGEVLSFLGANGAGMYVCLFVYPSAYLSVYMSLCSNERSV